MKKGMAILAGVIVIGGGLWLGGAWYTGTRLEARSAEEIPRINAELNKAAPGWGLEFRQESFERSLFSSQARYTLAFEDSPGKTVTVALDTRYEHGPFPAGALASGRFAPRMAVVHTELARTPDVEKWFQATRDDTPFRLEAIMAYGGDTEFKGRFAPARAEADGGQARLEFSGAGLQGTYALDTQHLVGTIDAPRFTVEGSHDELHAIRIAGTQLDFDTMQGNFGMQKGKVELRVDRFALEGDLHEQPWEIEGSDLPDLPPAITSPAPNRFSAERLVYGGVSSEDEQFVRGEVYLRGEEVAFDGRALGSQSFTLKLDRLDGRVLQRIMTAFDTLAAASPDGIIDSQDYDAVIAENGIALLAGNPSLALDPFVWKTDKGESRLAIEARFVQPANVNMPMPFLLIQALELASVDLDLHKPMAVDLTAKMLQLEEGLDEETALAVAQEMFDEEVAQTVQAGFAREDGDRIITKMQFDGETLTVNGRDIPWAEYYRGSQPR